MPLLPMGPKEKWEIELAKVSKRGLEDLAVSLITCYLNPYGPFNRDNVGKLITNAKKTGRYLNVMASIDEYATNPERAVRKWVARGKAAKKAARTRKRARKVT